VKSRSAIALVALALATTVRAEEPAKPVERPKVLELPKGIELLSLKPPATEAAGGFILPGSKVDVIFRTTDPKMTVHLENLTVYAVDSNNSGETLISVGVTKTQGKIVALLVQDKVKPQFVLRPREKN
jgi:Flp pilus assembly protein CpaB